MRVECFHLYERRRFLEDAQTREAFIQIQLSRQPFEGRATFLKQNLAALEKPIPILAVKIDAQTLNRSCVSSDTIPLHSNDEKESTTMNLRLISATALLLALAGPAMAGNSGYGRDRYRAFYGDQKMPAQDAIRFGYGNIYPTYHSGWGGLYGDGDYPGSVDDNMGPPYWAR
jgi:hypothetical protein